MQIHHISIFVSFHEEDTAAATRKINEFERCFPDRRFTGRHIVRSDAAAMLAIQTTTLTIILETAKTGQSVRVIHDIHVSRIKLPPSEIIRIRLDDKVGMSSGSEIARSLSELGCEQISGEAFAVENALERLDILALHEPKLRLAASQGVRTKTDCQR